MTKRTDKVDGVTYGDWYEQQCVEYGYRAPDPDAIAGEQLSEDTKGEDDD